MLNSQVNILESRVKTFSHILSSGCYTNVLQHKVPRDVYESAPCVGQEARRRSRSRTQGAPCRCEALRAPAATPSSTGCCPAGEHCSEALLKCSTDAGRGTDGPRRLGPTLFPLQLIAAVQASLGRKRKKGGKKSSLRLSPHQFLTVRK